MRHLFRKTKAPTAFDYIHERELVANMYEALLRRTGIADKVARIKELSQPDWFEDQGLPRLATRAREKAGKEQEADKFLQYRHAMRSAVFAVEDVVLRRQLIACERECRALKLKSLEIDLRAARAQQRRAGRLAPWKPLLGMLGAGFAAILGWRLGGPMWGAAAGMFVGAGAVYGAVYRVKMGRRTLDGAALEILEETIEEIVQQEVFTSREESSGADHDARLNELKSKDQTPDESDESCPHPDAQAMTAPY